jgi:hypothetical protein
LPWSLTGARRASGQTAKAGDLDYGDLLASSSLSGPGTCVVE